MSMTLVCSDDQPKNSVEFHVRAISESFARSVRGMIETGQRLIDAREGPNQVKHGEFENMIAKLLPFGARHARRFMAIARHAELSKRTHVSVLPLSWRTLYELSRIDASIIHEAIVDGTINPEMGRKQVQKLKAIANDREMAAKLGIAIAPAIESSPINGSRLAISMQKRHRQLRVIPGKSLSETFLTAIELEKNNTAIAVGKQLGIGNVNYICGRDVVRLSQYPHLNGGDRKLVNVAIALMDETRTVKSAHAMVKHLFEKVWGVGRLRTDKSAEKRIETFKHAMTVLWETCDGVRTLMLPQIGDEELKLAKRQVRESMSALRELARRLDPESTTS